MHQAVEGRLYQLMADVFGVPVETISEESSPDTIATWDSLSHLNLAIALEKEFGVSLTPEDVMDMGSVRLILLILRERAVETR